MKSRESHRTGVERSVVCSGPSPRRSAAQSDPGINFSQLGFSDRGAKAISLQPLQSWATWTDPSSACFQSIVEAWCQRPQREREGRGGRDREEWGEEREMDREIKFTSVARGFKLKPG